MSNIIKVKINNNDDTRLWRYSSSEDFEGLHSFISKTWNNNDFIAQYEDDEGDLITIASPQDLKEAFDFARSEKKKSLKIFVQTSMKQKRAQIASSEPEQKEEPQQKEEAPKPSKPQFSSVREMVFDFLSNAEILRLLPEFFGVFISKLVKNGNKNLKPEEIHKLFCIVISDQSFKAITSHPLYLKFAVLAIPYISNRVAFQQSLYPHFKPETIKTWIRQLLDLLNQALRQMTSSDAKQCAFKDIVIDIQYPSMTDTGKVIHFGVECNLCGEYPVIGDRYKCSICEDWDCCTLCEPKHDHPLIKFKKSSKNHKNASFKGLGEIIKRFQGEESVEIQDQKEDEVCSEKVQEVDPEKVVDCICGAKMEQIVAKSAYSKSNTVYCDQCSVQCFREMIFHCPNKYDVVHHKNGYDLCSKCADKKIVEDQKKEMEQEQNEEDQEKEIVVKEEEEEVVIKEEDKNEVEKVEDKEKEKENENEKEKEPEFEYLAQLNQIKNIMALENEETDGLIKGYLVEHKGDISRIIPLLLQLNLK